MRGQQSRIVELDGILATPKEHAKRLGLSIAGVKYRLRHPKAHAAIPPMLVMINGHPMRVTQTAGALKISRQAVYKRIRAGTLKTETATP